MAYSLNGNNAYLDFSIGNLTVVDGGPLSIAALVNLGDGNNGAIAHIINSAASAGVVFLETFGTLNYGVNTIARTISSANLSTLSLFGNFAVIGGSKADVSAAPTGHYGVLGSPLTHFTAASSLTDVGAGSASDGTFKIRVGRFLASTSEYINGVYVVLAIWKRVLTNAEWDSLSTGNYATWQGLTPDWMVEFTGIGTRSDATGGGGNELSRTGTSPAITLVADPPGFFGSTGVNDADTFTLGDSTFKISASHTETLTMDDSNFRITVREGDAFTLTDTTLKLATFDTDVLTMDDSNARPGFRDSDSMTLSDALASVAVRESDSFVMTESGLVLVVKDVDAFTLSEGTPKVATTSTDAFTMSDTASSVAVRESDSFTMSDATVKLGVTDSDAALLSETQRGNVATSESFTFDDTVVRLSLTVTDSFTLASELERLGVQSSDAFTVSDAVFSGKGSVTSGDTFALIEQEIVGGLPESQVPSTPITISLTSPSLTMKLGTPHVVISLTTPGASLELE